MPYSRRTFIIAGVLLFCIFEFMLQIILPDSRLSIIEAIPQILREDAVLFWRQRTYLNTEFQGANVITNSLGLRSREINSKKTLGQLRIICLGASPTFGWGVRAEESYPAVLEKNLIRNNAGGNFNVINAGQIGYSTYQGLLFYKKFLAEYSPGLITVSYLLNDIDRYRFFRNEAVSDEALRKFPAGLIEIRNILAKSRVLLLLRKIKFFIITSVDINGRIMAEASKREFNLARVRVSPDAYRKNLEEFVVLAGRCNTKIIFIKMPVNLSLPKLSESEESINRNENLSRYYYAQGCAYEVKHKYKKARVFFKKARDYLVFDCYKDITVYQGAMEEVAKKHNIPLVDAAGILMNAQRHDQVFNGPRDPIHPNINGHKLIAKAIEDVIINYHLFQ